MHEKCYIANSENNDLRRRLGEKIGRQNNMYEKILEANGMKAN